MKTKLEAYKTYCLNIKKSLVYFGYLRPLFNYLEQKTIDFYNISKDQLAQYFSDRNYKQKSINAVIGACRDFCKYESISDHASFHIKLLKVDSKEREYFTYEELLEGIRDYSTYSRRGMSTLKASVILKFLFFTAVRKGELLSLKRDKIDFTNCYAMVWGQKDKTERLVKFPKHFIKELTDYINSEPEEINAFNVTESELNYLTRKVGKYLHKNLYPHSFRHAGAEYMAEKGMPATATQRMLGHNSLMTTLIYYKTTEKTMQKNYNDYIG